MKSDYKNQNGRTLFVALVVITSMCSLMAQEIKVRSISQLPADITARSASRVDPDGNECAIVRVNIPSVKGMDFGKVTVGEPEYSAGEYLLYVPAGTKRIPVSVGGYKESFIDFDQFDVSVESKQVYRATLYIDHGGEKAGGKFGRVNISTTPVSTIVMVDGTPIGTTPLSLNRVPVGKHVLSFPNVAGYSYPDQTITVSEGAVINIDYKLKETSVDYAEMMDEIALGGSFNDGGTTYPIKYKTKTVNGKEGLIDYWDKVLVPCDFDYVCSDEIVEDGAEKLFWVGNYENNVCYLGLYKPGKGLVVPCKYINWYWFNDSIMAVKSPDEKWGLINYKKAQEYVPCLFEHITLFSDKDGIFTAKIKVKNEKGYERSKYVLFDENGISDYFDFIKILNKEEHVAFASLEDKQYIINARGEILVEWKNVCIPIDEGFTEGMFCCELSGKIGVIDSNGKQMLPFEYDEVETARNGWIILSDRRRHMEIVLNRSGNVYEPVEEHSKIFGRYLILPKEKGKVDLIDLNGNVILSNQDGINLVNEYGPEDTYLEVRQDEKLSLYDISLNKILTIDNAEDVDIAKIKDNFVLINNRSEYFEYGYLNMKGDILSGCLYNLERIWQLYPNGIPYDYMISNGLAVLGIGDKWGLIDNQGNIVEPFIYSLIIPFFDGSMYAFKDGKWIDLKVEKRASK